jgi:hypothetical protein
MNAQELAAKFTAKIAVAAVEKGNIVVTRVGDSGTSRGVPFCFMRPTSKPYISNSGDLTATRLQAYGDSDRYGKLRHTATTALCRISDLDVLVGNKKPTVAAEPDFGDPALAFRRSFD